MASSLIAIISGYEVEDTPAKSLRQGDIIYNPHSHTHLDNWVEVAIAKQIDTKDIEIGTANGSDRVSQERTYKRRVKLANPTILASMFFRNEYLDGHQIEYLQKTGHLMHNDNGYLVLTPYAMSEIRGA